MRSWARNFIAPPLNTCSHPSRVGASSTRRVSCGYDDKRLACAGLPKAEVPADTAAIICKVCTGRTAPVPTNPASRA